LSLGLAPLSAVRPWCTARGKGGFNNTDGVIDDKNEPGVTGQPRLRLLGWKRWSGRAPSIPRAAA
jgi:hypothetical protein